MEEILRIISMVIFTSLAYLLWFVIIERDLFNSIKL